MPGDNTQMDDRADRAHRHGEGAALRHPRGRPHGRRGHGHGDRRVARKQRSHSSWSDRTNAETSNGERISANDDEREDPDPVEGLRLPDPRPVHDRDRGHREADRCARGRARSRCPP